MNFYKTLVFLFIYFCFISSGFAQNLSITGINSKDMQNITVEFNDSLALHGIKFLQNGSRLIFPSYKNKSNEYIYFNFLEKNFKSNIVNSIKTNMPESSKNNAWIKYAVNKFNIVNNLKSVKAFVSVIFNDMLEVECRVMNGKSGYWVQWPSEKQKSGKWVKLFVIKDKKLKEEIENKILEQYFSKSEKI